MQEAGTVYTSAEVRVEVTVFTPGYALQGRVRNDAPRSLRRVLLYFDLHTGSDAPKRRVIRVQNLAPGEVADFSIGLFPQDGIQAFRFDHVVCVNDPEVRTGEPVVRLAVP